MTRIIGLKAAQPNQNVETASNQQLAFSSLLGTLPVFKVISLEYSIAGFSSTRQTVRHGLPFVPFYLMFFKGSSNSDRYIWYPSSGSAILTNNNQLIDLDRVDKDNISFKTESGVAGTTIVKVVIVVFAFPIALSL